MALIELDDLAAGRMPGVEPYVGAYMAQAAVICFEDSNHVSGVVLEVEGTFREQVEVQWQPLRKRVRRKTRQTTQSDSLQIPAYVAVVEFGLPHATVSRR